jgi:hypothetical protein
VVLASTPFPASVGTWYTLSLSFLTAGTVSGSVTGPGGVHAAVSAADPGGPSAGDKAGFYLVTASASLDDIRVTNAAAQPTQPVGACPVAIAINLGVNYGTAFTTTISFKNVSTATITTPWALTFRFANGQHVASVFNANWNQVGPLVTLTNAVWFPAVVPGATSGVTMGMTVTGAVVAPVDATFNGYAGCALTFS